MFKGSRRLINLFYFSLVAITSFILGFVLIKQGINKKNIILTPETPMVELTVDLSELSNKTLVPVGRATKASDTEVIKASYKVSLKNNKKPQILISQVVSIKDKDDNLMDDYFTILIPNATTIINHVEIAFEIRMNDPKSIEEYEFIKEKKISIKIVFWIE